MLRFLKSAFTIVLFLSPIIAQAGRALLYTGMAEDGTLEVQEELYFPPEVPKKWLERKTLAEIAEEDEREREPAESHQSSE